MDNRVRYGSISDDEKKKIFHTYALYLIDNAYEFEIQQFDGKGTALVCPKLSLTLDLDLEHMSLMAHTSEHSFMVNDINYLMQETVLKQSLDNANVRSR